MRATTRPPEFVRTGRFRPILVEVQEAYQAFCANGTARVAWRNLSVFLTIYLVKYFGYAKGLPARERSTKTQYLASLPVSHFGCAICETVYVLLFNAKVIPPDDDTIPWRITGSTKTLLYLSERAIHRLLLDLTIELDDLTSPVIRTISERTDYSLPSRWSPIDFVSSQGELYSLARLLNRDVESGTKTRKPTLFDASRDLLRRALSASSRFPTINLAKKVSKPPARPLSIASPSSSPAEPPPARPSRLSWVEFEVSEKESTLSPSSPALSVVMEEKSNNSSYHALSLTNISTRSIKLASKRNSIDYARLNRFATSSTQDTLIDDALSSISGMTGTNSFITAQTHISVTSAATIVRSDRDSINTFISVATSTTVGLDLMYTAYHAMLEERNLIPERMMETDWSGRGQHAVFEVDEGEKIPLQVEMVLGRTRTALVESVRCKRVRLVRKMMRCTRRNGMTKEEALQEVQHLYRVQHSHIVRLVGTYVRGNDLAILTYPCAEWNLEVFMRTMSSTYDVEARSRSLRQFFTCLAKVLDFMHSFPLKHMDIKPQNLLVRDIRDSSVNDSDPYKIYFTDFGISRSYPSIAECETESPTSFTRTYAAVEVILQESRGLSADIFSLGCVFAEMIAVILDVSAGAAPEEEYSQWKALENARGRYEDGRLRPYHSAVRDLQDWLTGLLIQDPELRAVRGWTKDMINTDAGQRPTARQIADDPHLPFACLSCSLRTGPEDFECAEPLRYDNHA